MYCSCHFNNYVCVRSTCRTGVMPVPPAIMDQCVASCSSSCSRNLQDQQGKDQQVGQLAPPTTLHVHMCDQVRDCAPR